MLPFTVNPRNSSIVYNDFSSIELAPVTIKAKKTKEIKSFLGFKLLGKCDYKISDELFEALEDYNGPEVRITSLKRHWNPHSQHFHGNAVDFEWNEELIDYLITSSWLEHYNLMFYIEDKPGSKKLFKYKKDPMYSKYVFENPAATGPHIHIGIKRENRIPE